MTDFISMLENGDWLAGASGPRYLQLRRRILQAIDEGVLKENEPLPSEREIAAITDLSRVTVRKAVAGLVEDQIVVQKTGQRFIHRTKGAKGRTAPLQPDVFQRRHGAPRSGSQQ